MRKKFLLVFVTALVLIPAGCGDFASVALTNVILEVVLGENGLVVNALELFFPRVAEMSGS